MLLGALTFGMVAAAGLAVLALGFFFALILNIAYAKLKVQQDPAVEAVLAVLPNANCGGCGQAGCGAYAEAVVKDHGLMGKCGPGGSELVSKIAAILGIEATASAPLRAVVHCAAKESDRISGTRYWGAASCTEAQVVAGAIGCSYGCLAMGDCAAACEFDALHIVEGLATVDYEKCVGCGACVKACPRQLIELIAFQEDPMLVVACSTQDKAKEVRGYCQVGCVGCTVCAKQSPNMFQMKNNLAAIDYKAYGSQEDRDKATSKCPRALLRYRGKKAVQTPSAASANAAGAEL